MVTGQARVVTWVTGSGVVILPISFWARVMTIIVQKIPSFNTSVTRSVVNSVASFTRLLTWFTTSTRFFSEEVSWARFKTFTLV